MRLSKSDFFITAIGMAIIASLGYLLYTDISAGGGPGNTKRIGKITAKRNIAERKFSNRVVWGEVARNEPLYNYDTVRTADRSEASLRLDDGTEISLSENSMILLAITEKEVDIKFIQGTINAKQDPKGGTARKVNIESGESKVALKNSDVSISQDRGDQIQMTVNRGTATLNTGTEEKVINENQNIVAGKDSVRLYDLTIRLLSPDNNAAIESTGTKTALNFSWETPGGKYDTSLEIANNSAVSDPLINKKIRGAAHSLPLPTGIYYWRISAVNRETGKVESSEIRKVTIFDNRPVRLITPANNELIRYRDEKPMIGFLWSKNESASRYKLTVSPNADLIAPSVDTIVSGNRISLNNLGQGKYFWKVATIDEAEPGKKMSESGIGSFTVSKTEKLEPPRPVYPTVNKTIHPLSIAQKGLTFNWTRDPSIRATQILIAKDPGLDTIIFNDRTRDNNIRFNGKLEDGIYYWGLRGVMSDGSMTDYSDVRRFKVMESGTISLIEPGNGEVIINKTTGKPADVEFSWSKTEIEGKFKFQISRNNAFSAIVKEISLQELSTTVPDLPENRYYWRVSLIDEKGVQIMNSPVNTFQIMSSLDNPVAISPLGGSSVDMLKKDTLNFYWKPVKGATYYRIGLYQVKGLIQYAIATLETKNNYYIFSDLTKLDVGRFLWTLEAVDIEAGTGRVIRKSDEVKMFFDIQLGIKSDLKLNTPNILHTE